MNDREGLRQGTLPNGLTYTLWAEPRDTLASLQVWVATGTAHEPAGQSGIAHMLEHMMFRGTTKVPDGAFDAVAERLGMYVNAATWLDYTFYTVTGPPSGISEMLALEADRFANLVVHDDAFLPERDVVANERRQVVESVPDAVLGEAFHSALFAQTPYAPPTIGTAEDIAAYTAESVQAFYTACYAPERLHIVIVGDIDPDAMEQEVAEVFGGLPTRDAVVPAPNTGSAADVQARIALPLASPRVMLGWPAPSRASDDYAAWVVFDELAAAAESSRLTARLEYRERLVVDIRSTLYALRAPSAFELGLSLRRGVSPERAIESVRDELRLMATEGVSEDAIAGAVARVRTSRASELIETAGRAEMLGESWVLHGDALAGLTLDAQVAKVTAADIREVANQLAATEPVTRIGVPE